MSVQSKLTKEIITKAEDLRVDDYFLSNGYPRQITKIEHNYDEYPYRAIIHIRYTDWTFEYNFDTKVNAWRYTDYEKELNQLKKAFSRKHIFTYGLSK